MTTDTCLGVSPPDFDTALPIESLPISDVTDGCIEGEGIYDVFMRAHMDAIQQEYAKQRIKGADYSNVYLSGMQAAMQNAVAFALGKGKAAAELEIAKYQAMNAQAEVSLTYGKICLIEAQIEESVNKSLLTLEQVKLTKVQTWVEMAKISDNPGSVTTGPNVITGVYGAQIAKSEAEVKLTDQKTTSETAQTDLSGVDPRSIMGRESDVRKYQANGFVRKAEVDAAKLYTDTHSVGMSALDGIEMPVNNGQVGSAMNTALKGATDMTDIP